MTIGLALLLAAAASCSPERTPGANTGMPLMARHNGRFRWRELVTREYALEDAAHALFDMERLAVVKAVLRPRGHKSKIGRGKSR